MLTFGIRIILLLLLIGGAIALIGDYVGRVIGRKRLTLLNLRPRYTAFAITILTGILIVFATLGIMLIVSQDARTALFGLEELRNTLTEKSQELRETKKELDQRVAEREKIDGELQSARANLQKAKLDITALEKTKDKLAREVEVSRKGKVLFKVGEVLLTSVIQAGPEKKKLEEGLKQILSAADAYVRSFGVEEEKHLIFMPPEEFDRAVSALQIRRGENIIMVAATRNALFGEEVPVRFEISENKLIYESGREIAETIIQPGLSVPEIEQEIKRLLSNTHLSARKDGVLPDPSGSMGSVPYSEILTLAKKIKGYKKGIRLKTIAKTDIYTIGPLEVDFKIYYQ
ncbi:hypothetical protein AMJ44_13075 [candidate division WOR-1 bacterium DG_54_3]|uniref:DUF3084 domain-containing protein n=1 Tax=candidate division WOR-1 bacterium DG_54_3 TaxID=1703775 RepID=A0A0S7XP61_UNCSA|nr:MAG: hypothetical protein AMJ44_13075 [candidate division WOR-1 bacterium DG_54_3]